MNEAWASWAVIGLGCVTFITRGLFLIPHTEVPIPGWLLRALKVAPLAAPTAVIVPEIVMTRGHSPRLGRKRDFLPWLRPRSTIVGGLACWVRCWPVWRFTCRCESSVAGKPASTARPMRPGYIENRTQASTSIA